MALVVGVFQSANNRRGSADYFGELLLGESCTLAKGINLPRNRIVGLSFRQAGEPLGTPFIVPPMNYLNRVGRWLAVFPSSQGTSLLERVKFRRLLIPLLSRQRCVDGSARYSTSLVNPCARIAATLQ